MDVMEAIRGRRSIRSYTGEDVSEADVAVLLDAGRMAPSGLNNQPWRFRVLRGKEKEVLAKHTKYGKIVKTAPVCIAVFFDGKSGYNRTKDMQAIGACLQNILLAAHGRGLGAVWLGEVINQRAAVEKALGVGCELMAVVAVGHPAESPGFDRKDLSQLII